MIKKYKKINWIIKQHPSEYYYASKFNFSTHVKEIEKNYNNAIKYYKLAMKLDYPAAFNDYGIMFEYGEGVTKDLHKALEYYKIAAQKGFDVAQNNLGLLYSEGMVVKRDFKKAFNYISY